MQQTHWEPVDPVVPDPIRQDNDKRNNIQICIRKFPVKVHRGRGQSFPTFISRVIILPNWVPDNWVYRLPNTALRLRLTHVRERKLALSGPVRDTPPLRAIPFRDSIAEGGIAPICLVFMGYRASIAEIPLSGGGIAPPLRMLSNGKTLRQGGGGIAPNWPC